MVRIGLAVFAVGLALALTPPSALAASDDAFSPFPGDIGGSFDLVTQDGLAVTDEDFRGKSLLVYFGYANCPGICTAALPLMGLAVDALGDRADDVQPVLITVDPDRDTPAEMKRLLAKIHPRLLGLTGTKEQLAQARAAWQVKSGFLFEDWTGDPIYSHGSFIYLMGPDGKFQTLMPPILSPDRMAEIIAGYL